MDGAVGEYGPFLNGEGPGDEAMDGDIGKDTGRTQDETDILASCEVTSGDIDDLNNQFAPTIWLEVLPSKTGTILAAILANIMTEGLTPNQENILGNFISSLGTLISYKASRDSMDIDT